MDTTADQLTLCLSLVVFPSYFHVSNPTHDGPQVPMKRNYMCTMSISHPSILSWRSLKTGRCGGQLHYEYVSQSTGPSCIRIYRSFLGPLLPCTHKGIGWPQLTSPEVSNTAVHRKSCIAYDPMNTCK